MLLRYVKIKLPLNWRLCMADTQDIIECPACGKKMGKVLLKEAGINIDICTKGCGGLFFDNRELQRFDEQHEKLDDIIQSVENDKFEPVNEDEERFCPVCGSIMMKTKANSNSDITIDECYSCGGRFLDHGELTKIRDGYKTDDESEALKHLYSQIGLEIALGEGLNSKNSETKSNSSIHRLFSKIMGS